MTKTAPEGTSRKHTHEAVAYVVEVGHKSGETATRFGEAEVDETVQAVCAALEGDGLVTRVHRHGADAARVCVEVWAGEARLRDEFLQTTFGRQFPDTELTEHHRAQLLWHVMYKTLRGPMGDTKSPVRGAFQLHSGASRHAAWRTSFSALLRVPGEMVGYVGEEAALLCEFLAFFQLALSIPGLLSVLVSLFDAETHSFNNWATACYSLVMVCWATLVVVLWRRRESAVTYQWLTETRTLTQLDRQSDRRREFWGETAPSPITGRPIVVFPWWRRGLRYAVTVPIVVSMLAGSLALMLACLHLDQWVGSALAGVGYSVIIMVTNMGFARVSRALTGFENHETKSAFRMALAAKLVVFQLFNAHVGLFFAAFWRRDLADTRSQLWTLFLTDQVRRLVMNAVVPYVQRMRANKQEMEALRTDALDTSTDAEADAAAAAARRVFLEADLPAGDLLDEWCEVVSLFGYVTFFAAVLPAGSAIAWLSLMVERRALAFRMCFTQRRVEAVHVTTIGTYFTVLQVISVIAVVSNLGIFTWTSRQAQSMIAAATGGAHLDAAHELLLFLFLEHAMLIIVAILNWAVDPVPQSVRNAKARWAWEQRQARLRAKEAAAAKPHAE